MSRAQWLPLSPTRLDCDPVHDNDDTDDDDDVTLFMMMMILMTMMMTMQFQSSIYCCLMVSFYQVILCEHVL